ncbi:MAG: HD domain-containing protein [Puniceicoccales bacterium]|jgi:3'-5' exoribonuclease|nr:HD domain-containing protein [Puniceicoccales bacterium]
MEKFSNTLELKTIPEGQTVVFKSIVVIKKIERRNAKNGSEFLRIEVGDKFSSFSFTSFSNTSTFNFFQASTPGDIIFIEGMSRYYQGTFSPDILSTRRLSDKEIQAGNWYAQLEQTTAEDPQDLKVELYTYVESIQNPQLKNTVHAVLEELGDKFFTSVAAKSMHHAYKSGLLEHTVHVTRAGVALLKFYTDIPSDLALAGMLLHDVGKVDEYEGDLAVSRTKIGNLQGHIVLGYRIVRRAGIKNELDPNWLERLEHIILSHQGQLEYGAAVLPATPEAIFVSLIDNLDAKMGMVTHLLNSTPESQIFSERFPGLETQMLVERIV